MVFAQFQSEAAAPTWTEIKEEARAFVDVCLLYQQEKVFENFICNTKFKIRHRIQHAKALKWSDTVVAKRAGVVGVGVHNDKSKGRHA